jgi:hypothetical protein
MKTYLKCLIFPMMIFCLTGCIFFNKDNKEDNKNEEFTSDDFNRALSLRDKNFSFTAYDISGSSEIKVMEASFLENGSMYQKGTNEYYWQVQQNTDYHKIEKIADKWMVTEIESRYTYREDDYTDDLGYIDYSLFFVSRFSQFTLNNETSYYEASVDVDFDSEVITKLGFGNKKLTYLEMEYTEGGSQKHLKIVYSNYGDTSIDFASLNTKNNYYVNARTLNFGSFYASQKTPAFNEEFNVKNADSKLYFLDDSSFRLDMVYDFMYFPNVTYSGSYTFEAYTKSVIFYPQGVGGMTFNGVLSLNPDNYDTGLVMTVTMSGLSGYGNIEMVFRS